MKKGLKRIFSVFLIAVLLLSCVPSASAYTVDSASLESDECGGNKTVFYVNTKNTKTAKIEYTCAAGGLLRNNGRLSWRYGYWEIKIWGRNSTSESWTYLSKTNIKHDYDGKISMKGYTQYRVQIYAWKTPTIGRTLGGSYNWSDVCWYGSSPKITFEGYSSNISHLARI